MCVKQLLVLLLKLGSDLLDFCFQISVLELNLNKLLSCFISLVAIESSTTIEVSESDSSKMVAVMTACVVSAVGLVILASDVITLKANIKLETQKSTKRSKKASRK